MAARIADNLAAVREQIAAAAVRAGRAAEEVRLLAVSKTQPASAVREAFHAGQHDFGENRVQEALAKMDEAGAGPRWHLIGHLQSNKAKQIPRRFVSMHSLDASHLADALHRHCEAQGASLDVLVQLNWSHEATKSGVTDEAGLRTLVEHVRRDCPRLTLRGLMTVPSPDLSEADTRRIFAQVRTLLGGLRAEFGLGPEFRELSMGMSHDLEWAIAEGATIVRVGTAIFGARP